MPSDYERLPTDAALNVGEEDESRPDPRFNPPHPAWWKRAALILFILALCGLAWKLKDWRVKEKQPQIIYADRYSAEHKYRPAASPIITERLKDGRTRIRGAHPTARHHQEL